MRVKIKMNNEEIKKYIDEISNDVTLNEIVYNVVKKIIDLPDGSETSISKLVDNEETFHNIELMFKISEMVYSVCEKINIILDKSKYEGMYLGLPFNIQFVKVSKKIDN